MSSVFFFPYNDNSTIEKLSEWHFGRNWPVVYVIFNGERAYVGETIDVVRRTEQHLIDKKFACFTTICVISNQAFNKSVALDLESFLIKYISADGSKELINGNSGVVDHNYFYKEAYEMEFREIWEKLMDSGLVRKSLSEIENSELFKYSPYKTLSYEQEKTITNILKNIKNINNCQQKSMMIINGGAGTGKTVLAVFLVKLLCDINNHNTFKNSIEDEELLNQIAYFSQSIDNIRKIGLVVPMQELRNTMKTVFSSINGLSEKMVLAPEDVVNDMYVLLIVDEAHRLYQRKSLPNGTQKFDMINKKLMGKGQKHDISDLTELDWIIKSSRMQVLFYDKLQTIRVTDIDTNRFKKICEPYTYMNYHLFSQMRCNGGNGYYEYIKRIIKGDHIDKKEYKVIPDYQVSVASSMEELYQNISSLNKKYGLCSLVTGPGWTRNQVLEIEGYEYGWMESRKIDDGRKILSIHKSQGFDLNYAGVIFGKEVYFDEKTQRIEVKRNELQDKRAKPQGKDEEMRDYVLNIYLTLMTRGIRGTCVYAVDEKLREYLYTFLM